MGLPQTPLLPQPACSVNLYQTKEWKRIRPVILARDGYTCRIRLPKCRTKANSVDHIIDWLDGGPPLDPTNLRAACNSCNVAQRNTRVAARARAQRTQSRSW